MSLQSIASKSIRPTKEIKTTAHGTNSMRRRPSDMSYIPCERMTLKMGLGRSLLVVAAAWVAIATPAVFGQETAAPQTANPVIKPIEFDVVSIKPDKSENGMIRMMNKPDGYSGTNVTLKMVLEMAYGIKEDLISGEPSWVDSTNFDIEAKLTPEDVAALKNLTDDQRSLARRHMFQVFLADRFQLKAHVETKQLPVYELVLAKNSSKMKEATPGDTYANGIKGPDGVAHAGMMRIGGEGSGVELTAQGIPVTSLVAMLSRQVHRTVLDKTGLTGKYDVTLKWTPDDGPGGMSRAADDGSSGDAPPNLFTAVQEQLGLKLQPAKGPVDTLVIDHVEKPSEN
jgi:uncharacterized protein (TIGR03435 family)